MWFHNNNGAHVPSKPLSYTPDVVGRDHEGLAMGSGVISPDLHAVLTLLPAC